MPAAIPKREGQGINGRGVSIAALAAMLILLPVMSASVITIGKKFGSPWEGENSFSGPKLHDMQNPAIFPTYMQARYDYTTTPGNPFPNYATGAGHGALEWNGAPYGGPAYQGTLVDVASERYIPLGSCLNASAPLGSSCGDDEFRIDLSNFPGDVINPTGSMSAYSRMPYDEIPWRIEFEAIDPSTIWACNDSRWGASSVDYQIRIHTWSAFTSDEWTDLLGVGTFQFNNFQETNITGGGFENPCYSRLFIAHDFSVAAINTFAKRVEWAATTTNPSCQGCPDHTATVSNDWSILVSIDNYTDLDRSLPTSLSGQPNVFEAGGESTNLWVRLKFHLVTIDGINAASRLATVTVGGIFWLAAVASTPAWNPLKDRLKKGMNRGGD